MPIFITISILALLAALWATISIVQHVRRSHRRRRFFRESLQTPETDLPLEAFLPPVPQVAAPPPTPALNIAPAPLPPATKLDTAPTLPAGSSSVRRAISANPTSAGPLGLIAAARQISRDMPQPDRRSSGVRKVAVTEALQLPTEAIAIQANSLAEQQPSTPLPAIVEQQAPAIEAFEPPARKSPQPAMPPIVAVELPKPAADPLLRRPVRSVPPAFALPSRRPDWAYFNKDMGDLSDPTPSRIRDRVRLR
jgi:hypothetical protein